MLVKIRHTITQNFVTTTEAWTNTFDKEEITSEECLRRVKEVIEIDPLFVLDGLDNDFTITSELIPLEEKEEKDAIGS